MMSRAVAPFAWLAACLAISASAACASGIAVGTAAPDFTATSVVAGKLQTFHLADRLKHGAIVLYFFPKAFSEG